MKRAHRMALAAIVLGHLFLCTWGIGWGVPSVVRNCLYFAKEAEVRASLEDVTPEAVAQSMTAERERLAGSRFNPIRSYHPDESNFIKSVSNMNPRRLDFNPHFFYHGPLYIYLFGAVLGAGALTGAIEVTQDILFYFLHPEAIARFYLAGRLLSAFASAGCVFLTFGIAAALYDRATGFVAAAALAVCPLLVINAHYVYVDTTALFFVCAAALCAVRLLAADTWRWHVLAGVACGLAAATKYPAGIVGLLVPVAGWLRSRGGAARWRAAVGPRPLVAGACALGAFLVVCPFPIIASGEFFGTFFGASVKAGFSTFPSWQGFPFYARALYHGMGFPLAACAAVGLVVLAAKRGRGDLLVAAAVAGGYLFFASVGFRYDRYILVLVPFLCIAAARAVTALGRRRPAAAGVLAAVAVMPSLLFTVGYDRVFAARNVRTTAGLWLAEYVPAGSRIGVTRQPFQFEQPPINERRYRLCILGLDKAVLAREKPDVVVLNEINYRTRLAGAGPLDPRRAFMRELLQGGRYRLAKRFHTPPTVFGLPFNTRPSEDYLYLYPEILVFRRVEAGAQPRRGNR
jgi:hypothetical protein